MNGAKNHPYGNHTIAEIQRWVQALLDSNDLAVCRALLAIFERQTKSEQSADATTDANSVGFSGVDAEICSSFAKQYRTKGYLSAKQMVIARKKMKKYWKQLADIAMTNGKIPDVLPTAATPSVLAQTSLNLSTN